MRKNVEILAVGNELLIGQTLDTNSNWLAKRLRELGWAVERITVVQDSLRAIRAGVSEALVRKPGVLFTVGGLGPTHDDMTLRGISLATGKPLALNRDALAIVLRRYASMERRARLTVHRRKMAMLPRESRPLPNPIGTAPGVLIHFKNSIVVSLPGVPSEMKSIFKQSLVPLLKRRGATAPIEIYVMILGIFESRLAPTLEKLRDRFTTLYFKSHPIGRETGVRSLIKLHIYTMGASGEGTIRQAAELLLKRLAAVAKASH